MRGRVQPSRRELLRAAGAGVGGLLAVRSGLARAAAAPPRLVILYMPNCNQQRFWLPTGGRQVQSGLGDARSFTLGEGYQPLERVRQHLTLVEGLRLKVQGGDLHSAAVVRFMTGAAQGVGNPILPAGEWAREPSIDQVLLERSSALAGTGRLGSLELIADDRQETSNPVYVTLSWGRGSRPRPPTVFPHQVYSRLFGGFRSTAGARSVLDFLRGDLARLRARAPQAGRALDAHLDGIREAEAAVALAEQRPVDAPQSLAEPIEARKSVNHGRVMDAHFALVRAALSLDLTRVVTFGFGSSNSYVDFSDVLGDSAFREGIDYVVKYGVHAVAHRDEGRASPALLAITRWYADRTARFVESLAATPEPDGSTLLDNTLVVLFSETSEAHAHDGLPVALLGGRNLGLSGGRCLRYPGRPANDLWTALSPRLGAPLETFGDADQNHGPLPELLSG
jgi:hypothetical protein